MQHIIRGTFGTAEFEIYYRGELTNADDDVLVVIEDADNIGTTLESGVATNDPALGRYIYDLTPNVTQYNRVLKVTWSYELNGHSSYGESFYEVYTPYVAISDIIDYHNLGTRPSDPNYRTYEEIVASEGIARSLIDVYTYQSFQKKTGYQEIVGMGGDALELTERMTRVKKVYENGSLVIDYTADPVYNIFGSDVEITQTNRALRIVPDNRAISYDTLVSPVTLYYGRFRNGYLYRIEGDFGWEYVPMDIQRCAIMLAGDYLAKDSQWRNKYLKKLNMAELSFEMHNGAFNGTGNLTVDTILDNYKDIGITVI